MSKVKRVYVEKKQPFAVTAKELTEDIKGYLEIDALKDVRVLVRYDVENISDETYNRALTSVFSEPPVDNVYGKHSHMMRIILRFSVWNFCRDSLIRELIKQFSVLSF